MILVQDTPIHFVCFQVHLHTNHHLINYMWWILLPIQFSNLSNELTHGEHKIFLRHFLWIMQIRMNYCFFTVNCFDSVYSPLIIQTKDPIPLPLTGLGKFTLRKFIHLWGTLCWSEPGLVSLLVFLHSSRNRLYPPLTSEKTCYFNCDSWKLILTMFEWKHT